jgi:hypothetical protein
VLVVGALAAIVGSGLVSRAAPVERRIDARAAAVAESPALVADQPGATQSPRDPPPGSPVSLRWPRTGGDALTGATVAVEGTLRVRAASVVIVLEGRGRQALAAHVVDTTDPNGGIRPLRTPVIDVDLTIPTPRPLGRLWVVIRAYDPLGTLIGAMYRPVQVAELSPIGRSPSDPAAPGGPAAGGPASRPGPTTLS